MKRLAPGARTVITGAAMALAGVALLTGCASSGGSASGGSGPTAAAGGSANPASGTAAAPASPTSTPATDPTTNAASAASACPTRYLKATVGSTQGAAGSVYITLDFTNISNAPCTLYGYPGVSLAGGTPVTQIGPGADRSSVTAKKLVTLAPGAVANALLRIGEAGNYPSATCGPKPATYLQIFPPNQTTPIYLAFKTTACSKPVHQLTIRAVQAGSGG
jgi:Protein of unknown function (DUF4232)